MSQSIAPMPAHGQDVYRAGTLVYTKRGLWVLSLWLLWGDFAFNFFEAIFSRFMPIYLKDLNASNTLIGLMTGSFAGLVNVIFLPGISRWSDNFRSRIGRRVPFLYVVAPLTVGALILVGFAPEIGGWLFEHIPVGLSGAWTKGGFVLGLLGSLVACFHFFNMVLVNSYNWLIRDVVPIDVMARFLAWFRIVGTVATIFFLWFVFPHLLTHRKEICLSIGIFYLVAFILMCRKVKEGEYPPPVSARERPGVFKTYVVYFRECLQIPLYRNFFLALLLVGVGINCTGNFTILFVRETLGIDMGDMGHIFSWSAIVSAVAYFPVGWLCDRVGPLRVTLVAIVANTVCVVLMYLFLQGRATYLAFSLIYALPLVGWFLGSQAAGMKLFPSAKFGQFSGAVNVFSCGALILGNFLLGVLMDLLNNNYRAAYLWGAFFSFVALFPMLRVMSGWKKHGGPENYVAPLPE